MAVFLSRILSQPIFYINYQNIHILLVIQILRMEPNTNENIKIILSSVMRNTLQNWRHEGFESKLAIVQDEDLGEPVILFTGSGAGGLADNLSYPNAVRCGPELPPVMTLPNLHMVFKTEKELSFTIEIVVEDSDQYHRDLRFTNTRQTLSVRQFSSWIPIDHKSQWNHFEVNFDDLLKALYGTRFLSLTMLRIGTSAKLRQIFLTQKQGESLFTLLAPEPTRPSQYQSKLSTSKYKMNRAAGFRISNQVKKENETEKGVQRRQASNKKMISSKHDADKIPIPDIEKKKKETRSVTTYRDKDNNNEIPAYTKKIVKVQKSKTKLVSEMKSNVESARTLTSKSLKVEKEINKATDISKEKEKRIDNKLTENCKSKELKNESEKNKSKDKSDKIDKVSTKTWDKIVNQKETFDEGLCETENRTNTYSENVETDNKDFKTPQRAVGKTMYQNPKEPIKTKMDVSKNMKEYIDDYVGKYMKARNGMLNIENLMEFRQPTTFQELTPVEESFLEDLKDRVEQKRKRPLLRKTLVRKSKIMVKSGTSTKNNNISTKSPRKPTTLPLGKKTIPKENYKMSVSQREVNVKTDGTVLKDKLNPQPTLTGMSGAEIIKNPAKITENGTKTVVTVKDVKKPSEYTRTRSKQRNSGTKEQTVQDKVSPMATNNVATSLEKYDYV